MWLLIQVSLFTIGIQSRLRLVWMARRKSWRSMLVWQFPRYQNTRIFFRSCNLPHSTLMNIYIKVLGMTVQYDYIRKLIWNSQSSLEKTQPARLQQITTVSSSTEAEWIQLLCQKYAELSIPNLVPWKDFKSGSATGCHSKVPQATISAMGHELVF